MGTKGVPFGYLEFSRAIGRKPCPHMRTSAPPAPVPVPGSGSLPGLVLFEPGLTGMGYADHTRSAIRCWCRGRAGPGLSAGAGFLPGLVLFEPGLTGTGYAEHIRSAIRTAPRNGCQPTAPGSWAALQRFRPNRCNCSVGFGPECPSRSAINSAPLLSIKTHQFNSLCVLSSEVRSSLSVLK